MSKKKKKPAAAPAMLNDKSYLTSGRGRKLPIYKCLINEGWQEEGMADIMVLRRHVNGHITAGVYLVDTFCTGVKSTYFLFNIPEDELEEILSRAPFIQEECSYELAHNIIYGAIAFAADYGIDPDPDFRITQMLLEEDTEDIELIELEFGKNGKPFLLINPAGDPKADYYIRQLEKNAGPGNFEVLDGRVLDELEDVMDEEDDYYAHPEEWEKDDWDEFIDETEPEELDDLPEVTAFMYEKLIATPARAARMLTTETQVIELNVSYGAMPLPYSEEEQEEASDIVTRLTSDTLTEPEKEQLLERIKKNIERWPNNSTFYNHLILTYSLLGDIETADKIRDELYERFPDYIFAKLMRAEQLLLRNEVDKVPAVFDNKYTLQALFPERDTFHISEFIYFNSILCRYFLEKGDLNMAYIYYSILSNFEVPPTVPLDYQLITDVELALVDEMEPVLAEAKESESKKRELIAKLMI